MARTEVKSTQIKQLTILIDDLRDFGPEDGGSLNLNLKAGRVRDDNTITDKAAQVVALTDSTTNFVEIDSVGAATANVTAFTAGRIPIAEVVTSGGSISTITDKRSWAEITSISSSDIVCDEFTATAGQTVFNLSFQYVTGTSHIIVWSSGVLMRLTDDYTETDTDTITFVSGRALDEKVTVCRIGASSGAITRSDQTATAGQTAFTTPFSYTIGSSQLQVYSSGVLMRLTDDYTETNATTVTFTSGRELDENITFIKIRSASGSSAITGSDTFNSTTGRTITHNKGNATHATLVTPAADPGGFLGEVWVVKGANTDTIFNSGTATTAFDWAVF